MSHIYLVLLTFLVLPLQDGFGRGSLNWPVDSLNITYSPCSLKLDTLHLYIHNPGDSAMMLNEINVPSFWLVTNWKDIRYDDVLPGDSILVHLYFAPPEVKPSSQHVLTIWSQSGPGDTLTVNLTADVATLYKDFPDSINGGVVEIGTKALRYVTYHHRGTLAYNIDSLWHEGDSTIHVEWLDQDSVIFGEYAIGLRIDYVPLEVGSDTVTIFIRGKPCDSVYTHTIYFESIRKHKPGPYWNVSSAGMHAVHCDSSSTKEFVLRNGAATQSHIDSVVVRSRYPKRTPAYAVVASSPVDRIIDFVLLPADSVRYTLSFTPGFGDRDADLFVFGDGQILDTIRLAATVDHAELTRESGDLHFGSVLPGIDTVLTNTITNYGTTNAVISKIEQSGNLRLLFQGLAEGDTILPREAKNILISILDTLPGDRKARVTIFAGKCDGPAEFNVGATVLSQLKVGEARPSIVKSYTITNRSVQLAPSFTDPISYYIYDSIGGLLMSGGLGRDGVIRLPDVADRKLILHLVNSSGSNTIKLLLK